jgi:uncharacterized protein (TIGR02996 family)
MASGLARNSRPAMPDDPAFVRTIAANPDDDAPRLVYADVLDESGEPAKMARAEFIRVQIEKARLVPETPRWNELWHRDRVLLDWARQWRAELPAIKGAQYGGFIRGFIDRVDVPSGQLALSLSTVLDAVPIRILAVHVSSLRIVRALAAHGRLAEVPELALIPPWNFNSPSVLRAFARRGPWPNLRRLVVEFVPDDLQAVQSPVWRKVWRELKGEFGDLLKADHRLSQLRRRL